MFRLILSSIIFIYTNLFLSLYKYIKSSIIAIQVDAVQQQYIKQTEMRKQEKEDKKVLERKSEYGGYMDDMDLPPSGSEGEYESEEETVIRGKNGNDVLEGDRKSIENLEQSVILENSTIETLEKISIGEIENIGLEVSEISLDIDQQSSH